MTSPHSHTLVITNNNASKLKNLNRKEFGHAVISPLENYGVNEYDILNRPTMSELDSGIQDDSLLVICGGDGTVTRITNYLLDRKLPNTILPLPFGGANDISTGLYDGMSLDDILRTGSPDAAYTIEAIVQKDNANQKIIRALGYIGIGTTGQAAKAINGYQGTDSTEIGAIMRAAHAALNCEQFAYLDSDNIPRRAVEITAIKKRMGRYVGTKDTMFSSEFNSIRAENKLHLFGKFCLGLINKLDGNKFQDSQSDSIHILSRTVLQSDGENIDVEPNTKITFRTGPQINVVRVS